MCVCVGVGGRISFNNTVDWSVSLVDVANLPAVNDELDRISYLFILFIYIFIFSCFSIFGSILKSIEFPHLSSTVDDDDDDDDDQDIAKKSDKVPTSALAGGNKPLEVLLLERNKALQSENTALKVANSELQGKRPSGQKIFKIFFFIKELMYRPLISTPPVNNVHIILILCVSQVKVNVRPFFWPKKDSFRNLSVFLFFLVLLNGC